MLSGSIVLATMACTGCGEDPVTPAPPSPPVPSAAHPVPADVEATPSDGARASGRTGTDPGPSGIAELPQTQPGEQSVRLRLDTEGFVESADHAIERLERTIEDVKARVKIDEGEARTTWERFRSQASDKMAEARDGLKRLRSESGDAVEAARAGVSRALVELEALVEAARRELGDKPPATAPATQPSTDAPEDRPV
jgi:hypothetical protein